MQLAREDFPDRLRPVALSSGALASVQIYEFLRDSIIRGDIGPDTGLSEKTLCTWLGVSRQPVREALLRLATVGLIRTFAQRGSVVTRISTDQLRDAQMIREGVEVEALRRAIAVARPADHDRLSKELALQRTFLAHDDTDGFFASDERFHQTLGKIGGLREIWRDLETIKVRLDRIRYMTLRDRPKMQALHDDHAAIAAGLAAADERAATSALRRHLRQVLLDVAPLQAQHPEHFEHD